MDMIGSLDSFLRTAGEDIILRRTTAGADADQTVRASVRAASLTRSRNNQLMDGTSQDDLLIVMSMSEIRASGWPNVGAAQAAPYNVDVSIPRRGDKVIVKGRLYRLEVVNPIAVANEVVRVTMTTKGGASGA